jgi:DNA-binding Lrp family transcriptional regulator
MTTNEINSIMEDKEKELKNPDLLKNIIKEIDTELVIGEDINKIVMAIMFSTRLVKNSKPTSKNIVVTDKSGGGKDNLVKQTALIMLPEKQYKSYSRITDKGLSYLDKKTNWDNIVLHLEDPEPDFLENGVLKCFASGTNHTFIVDNHEGRELNVTGKPVMIVTTFTGSPNMESIRRWKSINMDTSDTLTRAVTKIVGEYEEGIYKPVKNMALREGLQSLLSPVKVKIPNASKLCLLLPTTLDIRTSQYNLYDYIKASTALHQMQRERNENNEVLATPYDIIIGYFVYLVTTGEYNAPISKNQRIILKAIQEKPGITHKKIIELTGLPSTTVWDNIRKLMDIGLLKTKVKLEGNENFTKEIQEYYCQQWTSDSQQETSEHFGIVSVLEKLKSTGVIEGGNSAFRRFQDLCKHIKERGKQLNLECLTNIKIAEVTINNNNLTEGEGTSESNPKYAEIRRSTPKSSVALRERLIEMELFINKNQKAGYSITYDFLTNNYEKPFIDKCISEGILFNNGKEYMIRG